LQTNLQLGTNAPKNTVEHPDEFLLSSFSTLVEQSDEGFFFLNSNCNIVYLNKKASNITQIAYGVTYKPGDNIIELAPASRKEIMQILVNKTLSGETVKFQAEFISAAKDKIFIDCKYTPVRNSRQEITGVCILLKDVTAKRELETSEIKLRMMEEKQHESFQLFEQFMENSPLRAWITDADGFVYYMNSMHQRFVGVQDDYKGKHLSQIFPAAIAGKYATDDQEALKASEPIEILQKVQKLNGKKGIYKVYKFPVWIKNRRMIAGWAIEVTRIVQLQKKLLTSERRNRRAMIRSIIETQEKERRMLSVELHDNVNQIISSCKLMLEVARESESHRPDLIDKSYQSLKEVIVEIRKISHNLNPSALEDIGLVEAVNELVERINAAGKTKIEFDHLRYKVTQQNTEGRITIYRIIQEGLNNIVKHAKASKVWITLYSNEAHILITIRDNGIGFNLDQVKKGLGLRNILHRVEYHRGKVKLQTSPGNGCTLKVLLVTPKQ
jgi:PAS domain S-box-containing protein